MPPIDLPHSDAGPRDASAIILLHGFPFDHRMWSHARDALLAAGHRVIVPDLRGLGKAPLARPAGVGEMAEDVLRLADRAGIRRFALAGFSLGGYVALDVARRAPERLARLALVDTRAEPDAEEARAGRHALAAKVRATGAGALVEAMMAKMLTPETRAGRPQLAVTVEAMMLATPPEGAALALEGIAARPDSRPLLPKLAMPALIVVGALDPITPPAASESMAAAIPRAKLVIVPSAAHLTPMESPEAVSSALVAWARA